MLMIEVKASKNVDTEVVQAKADVAKQWCTYATEHAQKNGSVKWDYMLVPDTAIFSNVTLDGLCSKYALTNS